ncbi:(4Fe-4S)-binding protein [Chryseobacterium shandongense]|uniref:(4Fe-4S)-binding protein n=1 Tax=Chryseobacterium shandongense TaxID=1493872 RepID=A0AAD0YA63_9FLAO|nr:(4Fe-4S)-binding protein [Chryseobacterium shandongense]AZA85477.1 (4Fe-4S)-binding protein [Chryseobacterium shandongense]AZA97584.1 (4Fe-4S)-binding protein [Chryseobacterium shandongense]
MENMKEYKKGDFTIIWQPKLCTHAGICVKSLPKVYNPKASPWVKCDNATIEELKDQIHRCPSGALSFKES